MLLKHVYMGWKFQRTLKLDISFSLEHFFIPVAIFTQVASAPLMELTTKCFDEDILFLRHCCLAIKFREVFVDNMSTYVNEVKLI